jgi:hypothetical protein
MKHPNPPQTKDEIIMQLEKRIMALDDKVKLLQRDNEIFKATSVMPRRLLNENTILRKRIKAILKYATLPDPS